jgi:hypothetical protein
MEVVTFKVAVTQLPGEGSAPELHRRADSSQATVQDTPGRAGSTQAGQPDLSCEPGEVIEGSDQPVRKS